MFLVLIFDIGSTQLAASQHLRQIVANMYIFIDLFGGKYGFYSLHIFFQRCKSNIFLFPNDTQLSLYFFN